MLENATNLTNTTILSGTWDLLKTFVSTHWEIIAAFIASVGVLWMIFSTSFQRKHERAIQQAQHEYEEKIREIERENDLRSLLIELKYNKNLADKSEKKGYDTSAYKDAKEANNFHVLPAELIEKINEAQIMLLNAQLRDKPHLYYVDSIDTERLKELYGDIVPKFEEYLRKTRVEK